MLISSRFLKKKDGKTEILTLINLTLNTCLLIEAESKRVYHESTVDMLRDAFTPTSLYLVKWTHFNVVSLWRSECQQTNWCGLFVV